MKKLTMLIVLTIISISVFLLGFNYRDTKEPNIFYQVYLDEKVIGVIESKEELQKYINKQGEDIKKKYGVEDVYAPDGLEIKRINTYHDQVADLKDIYAIIEKERPFTIKGYQMTIKGEKNNRKIFVTEEKIFRDAVTQMIKTFLGTEKYETFQNNSQSKITSTGRVIEKVYVEEAITIKEMNIPSTEIIYSNSEELAKYLLFGNSNESEKYKVKAGDTIDKVAFDNEISVEEFLISNKDFSSAKNLLFSGQEVTIRATNPQLSVVVQEHVVEDTTSKFKTEYVVDPTAYVGSKTVVREGKNGTIRVAQNITSVNGTIRVVSDPLSREELVVPISQVVKIGGKSIPVNVGNTDNWAWPTNPGWVITSNYGYRINPINRARELHDAIDIAGTGFGSNIYAANGGTVMKALYHPVNGNYIIINHNNGYYSIYAHLNGFTVRAGSVVSRGQVIGYMGHTGWATGTHLHFAIYNTVPLTGPKSINTWSFY